MLDRPLYDIACEQLDASRLDASRWQMSEWHPDGAHLWNGTGLNIVVTAFTTDHMADIGVYTDAQMEEMHDTTLFKQCRLYDIGGTLHGLIDFYDIGDPRAMVRPALPLPAPWPSAIEIAAAYIAEVRANGPEFMANVGNAYDDGTDWEIRSEISEMWNRLDYIAVDTGADDDNLDRKLDICDKAADLAIGVFQDELYDIEVAPYVR